MGTVTIFEGFLLSRAAAFSGAEAAVQERLQFADEAVAAQRAAAVGFRGFRGDFGISGTEHF